MKNLTNYVDKIKKRWYNDIVSGRKPQYREIRLRKSNTLKRYVRYGGFKIGK